jgi:hypothetical protein
VDPAGAIGGAYAWIAGSPRCGAAPMLSPNSLLGLRQPARVLFIDLGYTVFISDTQDTRALSFRIRPCKGGAMQF